MCLQFLLKTKSEIEKITFHSSIWNEKWFEIIIFPYTKFFKTNLKWRCLLFAQTFLFHLLQKRMFVWVHGFKKRFIFLWTEMRKLWSLQPVYANLAFFFTLDIGTVFYYFLLSIFKFYRKKCKFIFNKNRKKKMTPLNFVF